MIYQSLHGTLREKPRNPLNSNISHWGHYMKVLRNALIALLLFSSMTAIAAPASEDSIKELLAVTEAKNIIAGMQSKIDLLMNNVIKQSLNGKTPTDKQMQAITNLKNKVVSIANSRLAWETLEPMYLRIYAESFTEDEVSGMISFYRTPIGQAAIHKMPLLVQKSMIEVQKSMAETAPQIQKAQEEFLAEINAASK